MPAKYFQCPDGQTVEISSCLNQCRLNNRCLPASYLKTVGENRPWNGIPSVTQLLKGTREAYLWNKHDVTINPEDSVFMVLGTHTHVGLEDIDMDRFQYSGISGLPDAYEDGVLIDYKVLGSYKVGKVLGLVEVAKKKWEVDPEAVDNFEYEMQVNMYRIMLEESGKEVKQMKLCIIVRDGNTYMAKNRGIDKNIYYIDIPKYADCNVLSYFNNKRTALIFSIENDKMPGICDSRENWEGRKCADYCQVKQWCTGNPFIT